MFHNLCIYILDIILKIIGLTKKIEISKIFKITKPTKKNLRFSYNNIILKKIINIIIYFDFIINQLIIILLFVQI